MINTELFQKIYDQITQYPETHDQGSWEAQRPECGTTRCIAGWAIALTTDAPVYRWDDDMVIDLTPEVKHVAEVHGLGYGYSVSAVARVLLGLTADEAGTLFYTNNEAVREAVALAAEGRDEEFKALVESLTWGNESDW